MKLTSVLFAAALLASPLAAQKLRIIAFGAHPDDCDFKAGGTGARFAALGHQVKFVTLTDGSAGHQSQGGGALSNRRRQVIRKIREWNADVVLAPRPWDYHPDHRYTGVLVQDAAYMIMVPNICPETPALRRNPVFLYFQDNFRNPNPFHPDIAVSIDDAMDKKVSAIAAHVSQMFEWWPFMSGRLDQVPTDAAARTAWLRKLRFEDPIPANIREALRKRYGAKADGIRYAEAFEVCEYGRRPSAEELRRIFPL